MRPLCPRKPRPKTAPEKRGCPMKRAAMLCAAAILPLAGCLSTAPIAPPAGGGAITVTPPTGAPANSFSAFETQLNTTRGAQAPALNPLSYNSTLQAAAQWHANDMSINGYFAHQGLDGSSPSQRLTTLGYNWCYSGENIARGQLTETEAFTAWMNSPPHKAIMLSSEPTQFGLASAANYGGMQGKIWVLEVARPGC